jgi:hypothetical protein
VERAHAWATFLEVHADSGPSRREGQGKSRTH